MKPIALSTSLALAALLALPAAPIAAADAGIATARPTAAPAAHALAAVRSSVPESPAAAFERMLAPRTGVASPAPGGASADVLTQAFNEALWTSPASTRLHASGQLRRAGSTR